MVAKAEAARKWLDRAESKAVMTRATKAVAKRTTSRATAPTEETMTVGVAAAKWPEGTTAYLAF